MKQLDLFSKNPIEEENNECMLSFPHKGEEKFIGPYSSETSAKNFNKTKRFSGPYLIPEDFDRRELIPPEHYTQH